MFRFAIAASVVALVLIAPVGASASPVASGFSAAAGKVRCAVGVPHQAGLICAATGVKQRQYDGRGVVRLLPNGTVSVVRSGSDLLLAIDGSRPGGARPALAPGHTWHAAGFSCANRAGTVTCRRSSHGFDISARSYRRF